MYSHVDIRAYHSASFLLSAVMYPARLSVSTMGLDIKSAIA